jgi:hypothetical protein
MEIRSALKRLVVTRRLGEGSSSSLGPFSGHSVAQDKISGLNAGAMGIAPPMRLWPHPPRISCLAVCPME